VTKPEVSPKTAVGGRHYAGIFLLSFATLLLELALTRILSVSNWYHFGFLVVSTALLGFGAAGVTLSLWKELREQTPLDVALISVALMFGFVTLASFWLMQRVPFYPFRIRSDHWQLVTGILYYLVLAAPFYFSGLAISLLLSRGGREVNRLYAADLVGAGAGCVALWGVMPAFGGSGSIVVVAALGVLAALAFGSFRLSKLTLFCGLAGVGMLALGLVAEQALPIIVIPEKRHPLLPKGRPPIFTEWNTFSRIEVFDAPSPDPTQPGPHYYSIIIDGGAAGTGMGDLSMGVRNFLAHSSQYHPAGVQYVGKDHPRVLIIGSGAGREVLEALYFGASSVTAVEINPIINDIVTRRLEKHWGGLFEQPEVKLVTEDGRSFVRRSKDRYDAIVSLNTYSTAALSSGALTLSESYIMTREAFEDYWNHLTPDGVLLVWGYNVTKLIATTREMFDRLGLGSAANHLFAFRGTGAAFGPRQLNVGLLLKKSPLRPEEVDLMARRVGIGAVDSAGDEDQPEILYSPFTPGGRAGLFHAELLKSPDLERLYNSTNYYLRPATDDKPFFNQTRRWKWPLGFREVLTAEGESEGTEAPVNQVILVVMLIQSLVVGGLLILLPLLRFNRQGLRMSGQGFFLTYFAGLGLGFILIEIVLLQRLVQFLGQPIYTFSVVLASLLVFTGVGSYLAGRIQDVSYRTLAWLLSATVGGIVLTLIAMPPILSWALGLTLPLRVSVAVLLVAPLGILLGTPFSTGLRLVGEEASPLVPWAWGVNSFFTVIGSVAAMILAMTLGFTAVLIVAAGCYGTALMAMVLKGAQGFETRRISASPVETPTETTSAAGALTFTSE
jgi:SAM-dependent methyltransferase